MLEKYEKLQPNFCNFITSVVNNNKISHAYLIECNNVSYSKNLASELAKFFLYNNDLSNKDKIINDVDKKIYPDLFFIDEGNCEIKKEKIRELKLFFSKKSFYNNYRIYIVNNIDMLNVSSSNALLKFLEEPEEDIIAILLTNNIANVLDTIVSRCQVLTLNPDFNIENEFNFELVDKNDIFCNDYDKNMQILLSFYTGLEEKKFYFASDNIIYLYKNNLNNLFLFGLYFYIDILNLLLRIDIIYMNMYFEEKKKIMAFNTKNDIMEKIDLINEFLKKSNMNVNKDLLIDDFIIKMSGVDICD